MSPPSKEAKQEDEEDEDDVLETGRDPDTQDEEEQEDEQSEGFDASSGSFNTGPVNLDSNIYDPVTSGGDGSLIPLPEDD
jgi:hypothetical protein